MPSIKLLLFIVDIHSSPNSKHTNIEIITIETSGYAAYVSWPHGTVLYWRLYTLRKLLRLISIKLDILGEWVMALYSYLLFLIAYFIYNIQMVRIQKTKFLKQIEEFCFQIWEKKIYSHLKLLLKFVTK